MDDTMDSVTERSPKAPRLAESPKQQTMQITSTDLELYEHEDAAVQFDFEDADLDKLEQYQFEFYDDEFLESSESSDNQDAEMARILQQLTFPFSAKEPDLSADEMGAS